MTGRMGWAGLLVAAALWGCAPAPPWDATALELRFPGLDAQPLADATPYLLPARGTLRFFLCRWRQGPLIPVSLPEDASPGERALLEEVLAAWEGADLGVRFGPAGAPGAGIAIHFLAPAGEHESTPRVAYATADCALARSALDGSEARVLSAWIVSAAVYLRRSERSTLGREVVLTREELAGSALHELGHALGFQGHATRGATVMNFSVDHVRHVGRRILAREEWTDPALSALYAVPSGVVVRQATLLPEQTGPVDGMTRRAISRGWRGPFARVGDRMARLHWRGARGRSHVLLIPDVAEVLRDPMTLRVVVATPDR